MTPKPKSTHGGKRTGSGRKPNPSVVKRIPVSLVPVVESLLMAHRQPLINTDAPLPLDALLPHPDPLSLQIPLALEKIPAGFPSPAEGYSEDTLDFNEHLVRNKAATFIVRCGGNSMLDAGIAKDDLLVIDRSVTPGHRDIVMADLGAEYTIKRLHLFDGRAELRSENSQEKHPDFFFEAGQELSIVGVVMHVLKDMRAKR